MAEAAAAEAVERVMGERELHRSVQRLASEIVERLGDPSGYALVGIVRGGWLLCQRLAEAIAALEGSRPQTGSLDITLYRDDLYTGIEKPVLGATHLHRDDLYTGIEKPVLGATHLPFGLNGRGVVLVDDVLFTGRTVRAALDELMDYGRPRYIQLAVLIDRGHRELPIAPDFVGRRLDTAKADRVVMALREEGAAEDGVSRLRARGGAA